MTAWDVHQANLFDHVEPKTGIVPFGRLLDQVMNTELCASARWVFWVVDNGSSHAVERRSPASRRPADRSADRSAHPHLLAERDRALLLNPATQSAHPDRPLPTAPTWTQSPTGCLRSRPTTGRSPGRSNGPSPAKTYTRSSPGSPTASPLSDSRSNGQYVRTAY
jgi:hypothetical protein